MASVTNRCNKCGEGWTPKASDPTTPPWLMYEACPKCDAKDFTIETRETKTMDPTILAWWNKVKRYTR